MRPLSYRRLRGNLNLKVWVTYKFLITHVQRLQILARTELEPMLNKICSRGQQRLNQNFADLSYEVSTFCANKAACGNRFWETRGRSGLPAWSSGI